MFRGGVAEPRRCASRLLCRCPSVVPERSQLNQRLVVLRLHFVDLGAVLPLMISIDVVPDAKPQTGIMVIEYGVPLGIASTMLGDWRDALSRRHHDPHLHRWCGRCLRSGIGGRDNANRHENRNQKSCDPPTKRVDDPRNMY